MFSMGNSGRCFDLSVEAISLRMDEYPQSSTRNESHGRWGAAIIAVAEPMLSPWMPQTVSSGKNCLT